MCGGGGEGEGQIEVAVGIVEVCKSYCKKIIVEVKFVTVVAKLGILINTVHLFHTHSV